MTLTSKTIFSFIIMLLFINYSFGAHLSDNLQISAKLSGAEEVPSVSTNAVGVASFMINSTKDEICFNISVNGLSGPITGIHVHEGAIGENGAVVTDLSSYIVDNRIAGSLSGSDLTPAMLEKYLNGDYYLNVHTTANPNGEIRGQLVLETDYSYFALLDGAQEVPAVSTPAQAVGVFNLARHKGNLDVNVVIDGLSGPITGAHLHNAAAGANGGVVADLTTMVTGNNISGSLDPSTFLSELEMGNIYINVHTALNPNGEIRGQLMYSPSVISFDASIDGAQEVPTVNTLASGVAHIVITNSLDEIKYEIQLTDLSGPITGAHFHEGTAGNNGNVLLDLSGDVNGNRISGNITGSMVTTEIINKFLSGGIYLNIHTDANPNGEIRGQVYRLTREGFTMSLDGMQEVPGVTSDAKGAGLITINRDRDNAHIMIVYSNLSGANTGMHLHNAAAGTNGGVIFDLTPYTAQTGPDDGVFLYWKSDDVIAFGPAEEVMIRSDEVYVNVHSTNNPNGEIRGQALRGTACYNITKINEAFVGQVVASTYPVPITADRVNLNLSLKENLGTTEIQILDLAGRIIERKNVDLIQGENVFSFDAFYWNKGVYFITVRKQNAIIFSDKLVKF